MSSIKSYIRQKQYGLIRAFCDSILSFYSKKQYFRTAMAAILNIGRHFEFLRWLTGFLKRATPKEDVCQFWCLYPEVNYSPDICMLAAPLYERRSSISANVTGVRGNRRTTFVNHSDVIGAIRELAIKTDGNRHLLGVIYLN